ncbi:MAG: Ig-like domain repeat protein, partial [Verrucomicrobiota bacterium]
VAGFGLSHAAPIAVSSYTYDRGSIGWGSDTGNRLTDGVIPSITFWSDTNYVGFNGTWPQITFDLGTSNNLGTVDLSYWADSTSIFGPQNILGDRLKISVSDDNITYSTPVQYSPFTGPLDHVVTSSMNVTGMSGRYVRLDFQKNPDAAWLFFGEVAFSSAASGTATTTTLARHTGTDTPSTYGASLSFDAAVAPATATGTVELYDGGAAGTLIGTGTLSSGVCTITPVTTALVLGTHDNIVAVYGGDSSDAGSTSAALSPAQVVNPGPAVTLRVTTPPSGGEPGVAWATQPKVKLLDAFGNTANSSAPITLAITTATPASGGPGTLSGTTTVSAVNGVATFSGLSITTAGVGYRLTATDAGLTSDSALFTVSSGTVLYSSADCSGQFPRTTLDFTPLAGHVYRLAFSLNNPVGSLYNALIGFSPYAAADNTYNDSIIDGFWVGNAVARQYNGGSSGEASFTSDTLSGHNGYRGPAGELDSNYEVVLDTTATTWTTATSMSSGLGTVSGSVRTAIGTVKSVQVRVRDLGPAIATISNFRLTDTSAVTSSPYDTWGNGTFANSFTDKD